MSTIKSNKDKSNVYILCNLSFEVNNFIWVYKISRFSLGFIYEAQEISFLELFF